MNEKAWEYLNIFSPHSWSRAGFSTFSKNQGLLNNMSEQFSATIVRFQGKPIFSILEEIRLYLIRRTNDAGSKIANYKGPITPNA